VAGKRCNCSICVRKGVVMSAEYHRPEDFEEIVGTEFLTIYRFGDGDMDHCFCRTCGISPYSVVRSVPPTYDGPAKPGYRRVNLGCLDDLDVFALSIEIIDGRSL
jgi:hypothetical protein